MVASREHRHHHHIYVVELSDRVWNEPRFRKANPRYRTGKLFVYVGMTGLDPKRRLVIASNADLGGGATDPAAREARETFYRAVQERPSTPRRHLPPARTVRAKRRGRNRRSEDRRFKRFKRYSSRPLGGRTRHQTP